ncbi:HNH endonuclease [Billgrantia desiderata]|nr:HNH endonuclease [Halomonas desiderata]
MEDGRVTPADTVDHIEPHRGDGDKFFDPKNLQSLCATCHSSRKQRLEVRQVVDYGCNEAGMPNDPSHHWNEP